MQKYLGEFITSPMQIIEHFSGRRLITLVPWLLAGVLVAIISAHNLLVALLSDVILRIMPHKPLSLHVLDSFPLEAS